MTVTFDSDSDIIVYALEKIISFARENQFLFVANCAWWIARIIGLDSGLTIFIVYLETRKQIGSNKLSTTPKDIARSESSGQELDKLEDSIRRHKNRNPPRDSRVTRSNPTGGIQKLSRNKRRRLAKTNQRKGL
jgi:hypothetical protein